MAIVFDCSGCGRQLRAADDAAGRQARCPQCNSVTEIPAPRGADFAEHEGSAGYGLSDAPADIQPGTPPPPPDATRPCPYCGETINAQATKCRFCGEFLDAPVGALHAGTDSGRPRRSSPKIGQLKIPAIVLIVLASLGIFVSLYNIVIALTMQAPPVNPQMPPAFQQIQQGMVGPIAAVMQSVFLVLNIIILVAAIMMLRLRSYGLAMAGAILSLVNLGSCCCILTMPFGIWSLVLLSDNQVKSAFR